MSIFVLFQFLLENLTPLNYNPLLTTSSYYNDLCDYLVDSAERLLDHDHDRYNLPSGEPNVETEIQIYIHQLHTDYSNYWVWTPYISIEHIREYDHNKKTVMLYSTDGFAVPLSLRPKDILEQLNANLWIHASDIIPVEYTNYPIIVSPNI